MSLSLKKYSHLLTIIGLNIAASALISVLVWLHYDSAVNSRALLEQEETLRQQGQQLTQLRSLVERTADDRQELEQYFVDQDSLPIFIEQLELLETTQQINLDLVSVEAVSELAPLIRFNLNLTGSQSRLLAFIGALEKLPYRVQLRAGKLQSENTEAGEPSWTGELVLELLSYQPAPEIEAPKQHGTE